MKNTFSKSKFKSVRNGRERAKVRELLAESKYDELDHQIVKRTFPKWNKYATISA